MQSAAILEKEVSELRAANEKQKQKRTRSRRQILHEGGLSAPEAHELFVQPEAAIEAPAPPPPPPGREGFHHLYSCVWELYQNAGPVEMKNIREMHAQLDLIR